MRKTLRVVAWTVGVVSAVIAGLYFTVLDWWTIPGDDPSMSASIAPALAGGDFVLMMRSTPGFGDLARCADPEAPGRYVIGRVLGVAGDTVEVTSTDVIVNGKRSQIDMSCQYPRYTVEHPSTGSPVELVCGIEISQGHKQRRLVAPGGGTGQIDRKHTVGDGYLFLVSDDRAFPMDSRVYGALPKASCKEQIFFRVFGNKGMGDVETRFSYIN